MGAGSEKYKNSICEKLRDQSIESVIFSDPQIGKILLVTQFEPNTLKPETVFWVYPNKGAMQCVDNFVDAISILIER
jgi:hypothetical protein